MYLLIIIIVTSGAVKKSCLTSSAALVISEDLFVLKNFSWLQVRVVAKGCSGWNRVKMLSFQSCLFLITQKRHRAVFRLPGFVGHSRVWRILQKKVAYCENSSDSVVHGYSWMLSLLLGKVEVTLLILDLWSRSIIYSFIQSKDF